MIRAIKYIFCLLLLLAAALTGLVYGAPETALVGIQQAMRWHAGLVRKEFDVAGIRHVYLEGGRGEPLVLLHGFGGEKDSFTKVSAYLTSHYRVIIPDAPGFGESAKPENISYAVDDIVLRTHAFIQQLGLEMISLGGNSMGGYIAAAYAAKYPDEVASLWLLAPGGVASAPASALALYNQQQQRSLSASNADEFRDTLKFVVSKPPALPQPVLRILSERAAANHALHEKILKQIQASTPLEVRLQNLATPALIVWGDEDRVIHPAAAQIVQRLLPNSQVRIMPGIGHLPMIEDAPQAARDYLDFRASLR